MRTRILILDGYPWSSSGHAAWWWTPGFMQSAGRVIRGEQDRGVVILLERRFQQHGYARQLPPYWNPEYCKDVHTLEQSLRPFWESQDGTD